MSKAHSWRVSISVILAVAVVLAIASVSCGSEEVAAELTAVSWGEVTEPASAVPSATPYLAPTATETPNLIRVSEKCDCLYAQSIDEMLQDSSVVVFGRVLDVVDHVDMASFGGRSRKRYDLGRVYEIEVAEYLRGDGPETITFVQSEAHFVYQELTEEALAEIRESTADYKKVVPKKDKDYVFFLRKWHLGPIHLTPATQPYRILFTSGKGIVEGNARDAAWGFAEADAESYWAELRELQERFAP